MHKRMYVYVCLRVCVIAKNGPFTNCNCKFRFKILYLERGDRRSTQLIAKETTKKYK